MSNTLSDADVNNMVQHGLNEYLNGAYADCSGAKDQLRCFAHTVEQAVCFKYEKEISEMKELLRSVGIKYPKQESALLTKGNTNVN